MKQRIFKPASESFQVSLLNKEWNGYLCVMVKEEPKPFNSLLGFEGGEGGREVRWKVRKNVGEIRGRCINRGKERRREGQLSAPQCHIDRRREERRERNGRDVGR